MDRIKEIVIEKGLMSKVLFLGNRRDVKELLQMGDVFVFPSLFEGFPGAVLEAQASGLPCLISDRITKEVVLLKTTYMLPLEVSYEEWAEKIEELLQMERTNTFEAIKIKGYDIYSLVDKLTEFYESERCKNDISGKN